MMVVVQTKMVRFRMYFGGRADRHKHLKNWMFRMRERERHE